MRISGFVLLAFSLPAWSANPTVYPPSIELTGRNATQVLAVSLEGRDVTSECTFVPADQSLLTVSKKALVTAQSDGKSTLKVSCGGLQAVVPVRIAAAREEPKLSFVKDVVPIFTMAGCAGSNCHGSIRGQNGFKLSLFGYEPDLDFKAIGPRIDRDHPEQSLILQKPTLQKAHGGGVRFVVDSLQYRTILDWIKGGARYDSAGSPRIATLTVYPQEVTLKGEGAVQQLIATATYTDGTHRDVTHLVAYSSNSPDTVQVSADGKIQGLRAGETAVMVRTLGQAVAAKIYVPQAPLAHAFPNVPRNNYIDEWVFSKLKRLNIEPSGLSSDEHFLRRVYLDTAGLLPTQKEAEEFLNSKDPAKRVKLIDSLLQRPEFSEYWALKYTELFRAGTREAGPKGARIIYEWVKQSFLQNKPYDKMVTELLLSQGAHLFGTGPSSFYNVSFDSNAPDHATNVSQLFLGTRIECAKCHNHPWERWTQEDFYGFAAFFARVKIKEIHDDDENEHYYAEEGEVINPKTNKPAVPKYLDGALEPDEQDKDIRINLAKWMTAPENPFFSRAIVNRVWKTYLGRGLVEDVDDFRATNPPTNPGLLDALAKDLSSHRYDLRQLIRTILNSRTYQLGAEPTQSNRDDAINYSRYYMKRMIAEQMLDTIVEFTGMPEKFRGFPPGTRAMEVYSAQPAGNYMLTAFGRTNRETICERDSVPDIVQVLHLISGDTINKRVAQWKPDPALNDEQQLNRIYLSSLARYPSAEEKSRIETDLGARDKRQVFQDLVWAILNSDEFMYNH
jgi:hypothetical protein